GIYLDRMFLFTLAGLVPAGVTGWLAGPADQARRVGRALGLGLAFLALCLLGASPTVLGERLDPYDAYQEQFQPLWNAEVLAGHARILGLECLPRLILGHRLPGLQADPSADALAGRPGVPDPADWNPASVGTTVLGSILFGGALLALVRRGPEPVTNASEAVRWGLVASAGLTLFAFIINRNIFNSDNYRYLVCLLVPWSLGLGLFLSGLARRSARGRLVAGALGLAFAALMSLDTWHWYRRFGWIDTRAMPARPPLQDPALDWLRAHPGVRDVFGGYWDVYRLSFLTGGEVRGMPYPVFPNRFPEWSAGLEKGRPRILMARRSPEGMFYRAAALRE